MTQSSSGENDKVTVLRFATEEGEKERDNYQKKGKEGEGSGQWPKDRPGQSGAITYCTAAAAVGNMNCMIIKS